MTGGTPGNGSESSAYGGTIGEKRTDFKAVLNGFLFNSISSSVTGNQVDSICSNMFPEKIIGTKPVGGTGPYTYLWEKSYDQILWTPLINDADPVNYTPTVIETSTVWFRRTITSSAPDVLVDVSKAVQIIVQPFIKNNIVGNSDTLCFGQDPILLTSRAVLADGNGIYSFKWQVSIDNINFNLPVHTAEGYTPPGGLTVTSWYRRTVTSGRCVDSSTVAKLTVLPLISNNSITNTPPDICYGSTFVNITASVPPVLTGGDLTFRISWESSLSGVSGWAPASGSIIAGGFNPDEASASFPGSLFYRRVVKSGSNDVCVSNSAPVRLNDYPVISNNAIKTNSVNKPICSGSAAPPLIDSLVVSGGNNAYAYSWEYRTSTLPWTPVAGVTTSVHSPGNLSVTTDFRRRVISSACSNISNTITIIAHNSILNNSISLLSSGTDTTLCNGANPTRLTGSLPTGGISSYAYLWLSSTDNATWTQIPVASTLRDYDPPVLTVPTYYKRQVVSGACLVVSASTVYVNVLPLIANNTISGTSTVCKNLVPKVVTGAAISGGSGSYNYLWQESSDGGATWQSAALVNNSADYQPPALSVPMKYRRYVTSGLKNTCQNTSNVFDISIDPLPTSQINAGPDDNIFSIQRIYQLKAVPPVTGETGAWKPLNNGTFSINDTTRNDATASNLVLGTNSILWTVHRGPCKLSDTVNIDVHKDLFPQGFSPNDDPYNNTFVIEGLDLDVHYVDLRIVNGAGTEVYKTSNRNGQTSVTWDGKNEKGLELPEGTYYYMLNLTSKKTNASVFKKSGFIILKRY
jgi:gliding motility-associated-like protein